VGIKHEQIKGKIKQRPIVFQEVEDSRFRENRHMKVVRFSALAVDRLYFPGDTPDILFC
jgi:hypothetical protein